MKHQRIRADRFFFAIQPDPITARRTDVYAESLAGGARRVRVEHQHMTLAITHDYSDYPYELIKSLCRAGDQVRADPLTLRLDKVVGGYDSVALRLSKRHPGLAALQKEIVAATAAKGAPLRPDYAFSPHQTLFYRKGAPFSDGLSEPFAWTVNEFVLIHSAYGETRHTLLRRWPLQGAAQATLPF